MLLSKVPDGATSAYIFNMDGPSGTPTPNPGGILPCCMTTTLGPFFYGYNTAETKESEIFPEGLFIFASFFFSHKNL